MARFRGIVRGGRGEASRLGHRGLRTEANGWTGGVSVSLWKTDAGEDVVTVCLTGGSGGSGGSRVLYNGPLDFKAACAGLDAPTAD